MTLSASIAISDLQRYPWKFCLIKYTLYIINVFVYLNCVFCFAFSLQKCGLRISCLYEAMEKLTEINTFELEKQRYFSYFYQIKASRVLCKWGIVIFAWRVTWNYALLSITQTRLDSGFTERAETRCLIDTN